MQIKNILLIPKIFKFSTKGKKLHEVYLELSEISKDRMTYQLALDLAFLAWLHGDDDKVKEYLNVLETKSNNPKEVLIIRELILTPKYSEFGFKERLENTIKIFPTDKILKSLKLEIDEIDNLNIEKIEKDNNINETASRVLSPIYIKNKYF